MYLDNKVSMPYCSSKTSFLFNIPSRVSLRFIINLDEIILLQDKKSQN